jgi:H+/Cl- antiporter ClcA
MKSVGIVLGCVIAAVVYGIIHDQITARICIEYFTIGHPPVFDTDDPTLLGVGWGVIATWWVGLLLGVPLALAARAGSRPTRSARSLVRPVVLLLMVMALCALIAGIAGWFLAQTGTILLSGPLAQRVPVERHVSFLADAWAHLASYLVGFVGGIVTIVAVWRSRGRAVIGESA